MNRNDIQDLLEKLAGETAPLKPHNDIVVLEEQYAELGYSQLNELLLVFGFDRVGRAFFRYLLDGETDYRVDLAFTSAAQLREGIDRFRKLALLLYGNVKFGFKCLSTDAVLLSTVLENERPISEQVFARRHRPVLSLQEIDAGDAYLTGYMIERDLRSRLEVDPQDEEARGLENKRKEIVRRAECNQMAYLASDHLDVYVATSMRERHEFSAISRLTSSIFQDSQLADLKLRWFDPTQAHCPDRRIDKGLSEALMLRRARCTIYLAQESDTLGKDSELASTLAQGKPVVAYLPDVTDDYFQSHLEGVRESHPGKPESEVLMEQLRIYAPDAAWNDEIVRDWCRDQRQIDVTAAQQRLQSAMKRRYDERADTLRQFHPLGIQVNLETGVGNGVLVVRSVENCARLVRNILMREIQFDLDENEQYVALLERISGCVFRVMTTDEMLTNTFWNFYLRATNVEQLMDRKVDGRHRAPVFRDRNQIPKAASLPRVEQARPTTGIKPR